MTSFLQLAPPCLPPMIDQHLIYFESGEDQLDLVNSWKVRVAADYAEIGVSRIIVVGRTDTAGSAAHNRALSFRRAEAVAEALIEAGFERSSLDVQPMGETQLLRATRDDVDEPLNRMVHIDIRGGRGPEFDRLYAMYCPAH